MYSLTKIIIYKNIKILEKNMNKKILEKMLVFGI